MSRTTTPAPQTPCELQVALHLGDQLARGGDVVMAVEHYRYAAAGFVARGEDHNALAVYAVLAMLMPHCLHSHGMLADMHARLGRPADAVRIYEHIAGVHIAAGRLEETVAVYRLIVAADATLVPRRMQLAELYACLGRRDEAVREFDIAARQLYADGRTHEYLWVARRLLAHAPDHLHTLRDIIRVLLFTGDHSVALEYLRTLMRVSRGDDVGRELIAEAFAAVGRCDLACRTAALLARAFQMRGVHAYDEAKRLARRSVAWNPHDRMAARQLANIESLIAQAAERDFADERATGVIEEEESTADLLAQAPPEEAQTNVVELRPRQRTPEPVRRAQVIYAQFG